MEGQAGRTCGLVSLDRVPGPVLGSVGLEIDLKLGSTCGSIPIHPGKGNPTNTARERARNPATDSRSGQRLAQRAAESEEQKQKGDHGHQDCRSHTF